jgi:uncharacterized repeat protein (TIGR03803 family)
MAKILSSATLFAALTFLPSMHAFAATSSVLTSFNGTNGSFPLGSLIADGAGNLYGTTDSGGVTGGGTVFELTPPAAGQTAWTETVIFSFGDGLNSPIGSGPSASLVADGAGNLYGTTQSGGAYGGGTVFELTPPAPGQTAWTETILFSFNQTYGEVPAGSLIFDSAGNLYGTTYAAGARKYGNVFELTPPAAGRTAWIETALVSFGKSNGATPEGSLIFDAAGDLYGTTRTGGASDDGTVFELTPPAAGQTAWTETILTTFNGTNGALPGGSLIFDSAGNLYGTTSGGGPSDGGTVFELTPPAAGQTAWTETVLTSFKEKPQGHDKIRQGPYGNLIADSAGNLYGTTWGDGADKQGSVFELTKPAGHKTVWKATVLTSFDTTNGANPAGSLIFDSAGNLYGTTANGGASTGGTVFELTP